MAQRRSSLISEVRETLIRAGTACGVLAAVWYGIHHQQALRDCAPAKGPHASLLLQHCISRTTSAVVWHWALILGTGTLLGLAAGVTLALMVPTVGRPIGPRRAGPPPRR